MAYRWRWLRRVGWTIGALLLLYLLLRFALPPLAKAQMESRATAALGRAVHIGDLSFEPLKLDLVVRDVQIGANPSGGVASAPLLTLQRLHVDLAAASIVRAVPIVQTMEADGLRLNLARLAPGHYDIDDLIAKLAPKSDATASQPARFALYNLQVRDAGVRFDDRPAGRVDEVTALHLALPFLSNLPAQVDVRIEPHLSFVLNGTPFDSGALATPFARNRSGDLTLKVDRLDLAPFLGYLPDTLPVRLGAGLLSTDIAVRFALPEGAPPTVVLRGTLDVADATFTEPAGAPLLGWKRLALNLREGQPLSRQLAFASVRVEGASLKVRRDADGRLNLAGGEKKGAPDSRPAAKPPASAPTSATAPPPAWHIELDRFDLADGAVTWRDALVRPAASLSADGIALEAEHIAWPMTRPIGFTGRGRLHSAAAPASAPATFSVDGSATDLEGKVTVSLNALPIDAASAYLAQVLVPQVAGRLSGQARLDWSTSQPPAGTRFGVVLDKATIDDFRLTRPAPDATGSAADALASLKQLQVESAQIDLAGRGITVGRLALVEPALRLARAADGTFDVQRWGRTPGTPATAPTSVAAPPSRTASAPTPWRIQLRDASMTGGKLQFADARAAGASTAHPLRLAFAALHLGLQNLTWQGDRPTVPAQIEFGGRVGAPQAPDEPVAAGTFDWRGVVGVAPLLMTGSLKVERLPVHLLMPYLGADFPVRVARAELGYVGNLSVKQLAAGWDVDAGADLLLGAVRIDAARDKPDAAAGDTLLSWNTLALQSARLSVKPGAKPRIEVSQAALGDFYARLAVSEQGKLNLPGLASTEPVAPQPPSPAVSAQPAAPASAAGRGAELPVDLQLGGTTLANGRIDFSDHFVRPNYSAALTELNGALGALRTGSPELATLTLRGKAAGTALLDITGHVNPIARPLVFDLHAKATDLELAPLSTYAAKYAGYAIERGKLSMDVSYRLRPDGHLDATNQVVLNQLTFGAKVDSPSATRLPVQLAVALLKDRHGVIDLDLPISGSLEDPQFSVAGIIGRLLLNLLAKALTSPFSLLTGGAGGGRAGGEPGQVEFVPGTTRLSAAGATEVDTVAKALLDKPGLLLTVTGSADAAAEQAAYRSAALDERLEAVRKKATVASAAAASAPAPPLGSAERARLVKQLYQDTDLPDKPRNVLGIAKDLPVADMQARLEANVEVNADAMRELALQRGVSVRDALVAKGLAGQRLFLAAPLLREDAAANTAAWVPSARLALTLN